MDNIPYIWLAKPLLSFAVAYFLLRKSRNILHKLVVRLMPAKKRFAPGSFDESTRWVNRIGIGLVLVCSVLIYFGIGWATEKMTGTPPKRPPVQQSVYKQEEPARMMPVVPPMTQQAPAPQDTRETDEQTYSHEHPPTYYEAPSVTAPRPLAAPAVVPVPFTDPHYIQLGAFAHLENAQRQQFRLGHQKTKVGYMGGELYPYKVLEGLYPNRRAAAETIRSRNFKGYPRRASDIEYLLE